ncbi:MAG TPA: hypothetical protein VKR32_08465 [Puia sp.]|nr:hypothetical protein [Puia sp.]
MVAFVFTPDKPRFFASLFKLDATEPMPEMDYSGCSILFKHLDGEGKQHYYLLATVQNIDKATILLQFVYLIYCQEPLCAFGV